jgi:hypothetical protein
MLKDKLNQAWSSNQTTEAIFEFRALIQNLYSVLQQTLDRINTITAGTSFQNVDTEIKEAGVALINILNTAKSELDNYSDLINWEEK